MPISSPRVFSSGRHRVTLIERRIDLDDRLLVRRLREGKLAIQARNDPVAHRPLQSERISDRKNSHSHAKQRRVTDGDWEQQCARGIDFQDRDIVIGS